MGYNELVPQILEMYFQIYAHTCTYNWCQHFAIPIYWFDNFQISNIASWCWNLCDVFDLCLTLIFIISAFKMCLDVSAAILNLLQVKPSQRIEGTHSIADPVSKMTLKDWGGVPMEITP